jgi:hypothetical protein
MITTSARCGQRSKTDGSTIGSRRQACCGRASLAVGVAQCTLPPAAVTCISTCTRGAAGVVKIWRNIPISSEIGYQRQVQILYLQQIRDGSS